MVPEEYQLGYQWKPVRLEEGWAAEMGALVGGLLGCLNMFWSINYVQTVKPALAAETRNCKCIFQMFCARLLKALLICENNIFQACQQKSNSFNVLNLQLGSGSLTTLRKKKLIRHSCFCKFILDIHKEFKVWKGIMSRYLNCGLLIEIVKRHGWLRNNRSRGRWHVNSCRVVDRSACWNDRPALHVMRNVSNVSWNWRIAFSIRPVGSMATGVVWAGLNSQKSQIDWTNINRKRLEEVLTGKYGDT